MDIWVPVDDEPEIFAFFVGRVELEPEPEVDEEGATAPLLDRDRLRRAVGTEFDSSDGVGDCDRVNGVLSFGARLVGLL